MRERATARSNDKSLDDAVLSEDFLADSLRPARQISMYEHAIHAWMSGAPNRGNEKP